MLKNYDAETIESSFDEYGNVNVDIDVPSICPICQTALNEDPIYILHHTKSNGETYVCTIMFCPHCESTFYATYNCDDNLDFKLSAIYPPCFLKKDIYPSIKKLSPRFFDIFSQSQKSEELQLYELSGMGYRKSLEFLIKDFASYKHPEKATQIKKLNLSQVINQHIDDSKIKSLSIACTWLGNDETHYIKKHEDYDLNNLKSFLDACLAIINAELIVDDSNKLLQNH